MIDKADDLNSINSSKAFPYPGNRTCFKYRKLFIHAR